MKLLDALRRDRSLLHPVSGPGEDRNIGLWTYVDDNGVCTRSPDRVRIATAKRLQKDIAQEFCTRSPDRVRIATPRRPPTSATPTAAPGLRTG